MKFHQRLLLFVAVFYCSTMLYSQRAKDGDFTSTALNQVVNSYTFLTANATAGSSSISVNNASIFSQGDLILIIQMQGASLDVNTIPTSGWGAHYTIPQSVSIDWHLSADVWGGITNYNNCGKFEQIEVLSVSGASIINFQCPLINDYTASGKVQVIRVPRYKNVTINAANSVVPIGWNGQTGGVVAMEIDGDLTINGTGKISATNYGFRGGLADNKGGASTGVSTGLAAAGTGVGDTYLGSDLGVNGARKGEGIGGDSIIYRSIYYSPYGRSAAGNGGGGAGYQNAGGGGGSNVGSGIYTGKGVPNSSYLSFWNLEMPGFGSTSSSGGGRGGYTLSTSNQDESIVGPNNSLWTSSGGTGYRKPEGGLGGHTLLYDSNRLFMGGGGGAGDQDNFQGGSGGNGGGIVFLTVFGNINGNGIIESNGADGLKSNPTSSNPTSGQKKGTDGAGGAGGGGSLYILNNKTLASTISLFAKGGKGGDNAITLGAGVPSSTEADGPGGGGSGGYIAISNGNPVKSVLGGTSGVTSVNGQTSLSPIANFPPNGATDGASGLSNLTTNSYDIIPKNDTVCGPSIAHLSVATSGVFPSNATLYWYSQQFGGVSIASGLSYTTPILSTTTIYYVGICPGTFRIPVKAVINPTPIISGTASIIDAGCSVQGSISGLSVTGGSTPYLYKWNGVITPGADLANVSGGSYTLVIKDAKECLVTSGPYVINSSSGLTVNTTGVVIKPAGCGSQDGEITGITAIGSGLVYEWNNTVTAALDITGKSPGNYSLKVTDGNGCSVSVGPYIIGSVGSITMDESNVALSNEHCGKGDGAISGIQITGGANPLNYSWTNTTQTNLNLSNLNTGSYILTVTDANGCSLSSSTYTISSILGPVIDESMINVLNETCAGGKGAITGITVSGTSLNYSWSNNGGSNLDALNLNSGSYVLTVTDNNNCVATTSAISIGGIIPLNIDNSNMIIMSTDCSVPNGSISGITINGGITPTFIWSNLKNTLDINSLDTGTYYLAVTDSQGCNDTLSVTIKQKNTPKINILTMQLLNEHCDKSDASITGLTIDGGTPNFTFEWDKISQLNTLNINGLKSGLHSLRVVDNAGCKDSLFITIQNEQGPDIDDVNMIKVDPTCTNSGSITGLVINGEAPFTYYWNGVISNSSSLFNIKDSSYVLEVKDKFGCSTKSSPFLFQSSIPPLADFYWNPTNPEHGESITFINTSKNGVSYNWNFGDGDSSIEFQPSHIFHDIQQNSFEVTLAVKSSLGCIDSVTYSIVMLEQLIYFVPNSFTPNNDKDNQVFKPVLTSGIDLESYHFSIFDRWGELVYDSKDAQLGWDGYYKGFKVKEGTYTWRLNFKLAQFDESKLLVGSVNVLR